jgi:hypothetical protein
MDVDFSDDTLIRGYQFAAPKLTDGGEDVVKKLTSLVPPDEFKKGHETLLHNFDLEVQQMQEIASAAEAGDILALRNLLSMGPDDVAA